MLSAGVFPNAELTVENEVRSLRERFSSNTATVLSRVLPVGVTVLFVTWLVFRSYVQILTIGIGLMVLLLSAVMYPQLLRRGQGSLGICLQFAAMFLLAVICPLLVPDLLPVAQVAYVVIAALAYQLLGDNAGRVASGVCLVGVMVNFLSLRYLGIPSWVAPLGETASFVAGLCIDLFGMAVAALVIRQAVLGQEDSFREAQRAKLEIQALADVEQQQRERLENTVQQYVLFMREVAEGNLSGRIGLDEWAEDDFDPLLLLGRSINETVASLQAMSSRIYETAGQLDSASTEILTATTQQAASANQQSAAIAQASTTIDEVRAIAQQTAQRAQGVSELAQRTTEVSVAGQQAVADTVQGMEEVKLKVETIASTVLSLRPSTIHRRDHHRRQRDRLPIQHALSQRRRRGCPCW